MDLVQISRRAALEAQIAFFTRIMPRPHFDLDGQSYPYCWHRAFQTWRTERAVEVAVAMAVAQRGGNMLEVGNVLHQYGATGHVVVDKYEVAPGVLNEDVVDYDGGPFDTIVSVSTLEHVGYDESSRDPSKGAQSVTALRRLLKPGGQLVVTVPVGYNRDFDDFVLSDDDADVSVLKRFRPRLWRQVSLDQSRDIFGWPYPGANVVAFARWSA